MGNKVGVSFFFDRENGGIFNNSFIESLQLATPGH